MPRLHEGTLADLRTLMGNPPRMRRGSAQIEYLPAPAAGVNFSQVVSSDYWRRIRTIAFTFTPTSTGNPRDISLAFADGSGNIFANTPVVVGISASHTYSYYGHPEAIPNAASLQDSTAEGQQTSPAADTTICSTTLPFAGIWDIQWDVQLEGTLAVGTDDNNFQMLFNSGNIATSVNPAEEGLYPQEQLELAAGTSATLLIRNNVLATTGAIYTASFVATAQVTSGIQFRIPDLMLQSGWQYQINVGNIQSGDQLGSIYSLQERYASDWASGTDAWEEEMFIDRIMERLAGE